MPLEHLKNRLERLTREIAGRPLDEDLDAWLNLEHGAGSETLSALRTECEEGVRDGWLCDKSHAGIRYGRPFEPSPELSGFSVDVVEMQDIEGPHHEHPNGEIDLILPLDPGARFDGRGEGWMVYGPGSAHHPTVTGGKALVLYLLPEGAIKFTRRS